jgi:hypothetical protein
MFKGCAGNKHYSAALESEDKMKDAIKIMGAVGGIYLGILAGLAIKLFAEERKHIENYDDCEFEESE